MKFYLIMSFLFGIILGLIDFGLSLNWFENIGIGIGFYLVCLFQYDLQKSLKEQK